MEDQTSPGTGIEVVKLEDEKAVGSRGLRNIGGMIAEDYQKELRTLRQRVAVYSEMSNDPYLGASLYVLETLMAGIEYRIKPKKGMENNERAIAEADFFSKTLHNMATTWEDFQSELLTMLTFGFAAMERTFKRGTDGRIVFDDIALRPAETIWEWVYVGDRLTAIKQNLTMTQVVDQTPTIPIENIYLFRTSAIKNNPEGRSILRRAYIPYVREKAHRDLEAIGHERDATGTPIVRAPKPILDATPGSPEDARKTAAKNIAKRIKLGTETGVVISSEVYEGTDVPMYNVELLKSPGTKQFDAGPIIDRCNREKLFATGTDIILLGHEKTGAINEGGNGADKRDILNGGLNAIAERICDVFNRRAFPELAEFNGIPEEYVPEMAAQRLQREITLGEFMKAVSDAQGAGAALLPDDRVENEIRARLRLPLKEGESEI